jgi:Tfp pilus assembly protein PilZ
MEKRQYLRIGPIVIGTEFTIGERMCHGYLVSLSEGGAFLATDECLPVGERLTLQVSLPWGIGELQSDADVVYTIAEGDRGPYDHSPGVGLVFSGLSSADKDRIRRYVEKFYQLAAQLEEKTQ